MTFLGVLVTFWRGLGGIGGSKWRFWGVFRRRSFGEGGPPRGGSRTPEGVVLGCFWWFWGGFWQFKTTSTEILGWHLNHKVDSIGAYTSPASRPSTTADPKPDPVTSWLACGKWLLRLVFVAKKHEKWSIFDEKTMKNDEKSMKKPEKYYLVKMRKKVCIFPGLFWPEKRLVHK